MRRDSIADAGAASTQNERSRIVSLVGKGGSRLPMAFPNVSIELSSLVVGAEAAENRGSRASADPRRPKLPRMSLWQLQTLGLSGIVSERLREIVMLVARLREAPCTEARLKACCR
jgi:hypothetical protein